MTRPTVYRRTVTVTLDQGLHLGPCSEIAKRARDFDGDVHIVREGRSVDAKTMLDLMTLEAEHGTSLVLEATGDGAAAFVSELVRLFESNFQPEDSTDRA